MKKKLHLLIILFIASLAAHSQDIGLYEQFNGRYDFTFVGNTLNPSENNPTVGCTIFTTSSAQLNLNPDDHILKAYLYWAGSGPGDLDILLNGTAVTSQRNFPLTAFNTDGNPREYFSAFADVTAQVQATGNGTYTVSDLDLTEWATSNSYCSIKTNFGGWAIFVVYENSNLPLNQLNLYDGLQYVPTSINITLPALNVIDNDGAKIGFIAWEGDASLAVSESLRINGSVLSNALNPPGNAFNSTNSVTGSTTMYNMDLDIYEIQNYIQIGDETAEIQLASGQDFVMVNAIISKLNSQLPDATVTVQNIAKQCNSRTLVIEYTVLNVNSTDVLPAGATVGIYVNGDLIATTQTTADIPIGGSESGTINVTIPASYPESFELLFVADHAHVITETDETNNTLTINETLLLQATPTPPDLVGCETTMGGNTGLFDLSGYAESLKDDPADVVTFYTSMADAQLPDNEITGIESYTSTVQTIYVRIDDANGCFAIGSFNLIIDDCHFPDATITASNLIQACDSRVITVTYTVNNTNGVDILPANTPVAIFAGGLILTTMPTTAAIPVGGSLTATITLTIPAGVANSFNLIFRADYGNTVQEISESNNTFTVPVVLWISPTLQQPQNLTECETGNGTNIGIFDFSGYEQSLKNLPTDVITFHTSQNDANLGTGDIPNPGSYTSNTNPQQIFVRLEDAHGCFDTAVFSLIAVDCLFPDATIAINTIIQACDSRDITVSYTVSNLNSFDVLPANTPVAMYANGILLGTATTASAIAIGGSLTATVNLSIPITMPLNVSLVFVADDAGTGTGIVIENIETNNSSAPFALSLWVSPVLQQPANVTACETFNGSGVGSFNFSAYAQSLKNNPTDVITFHASQPDAASGSGDITNPQAYTSAPNGQIFVRLEDEHGCFDVKSFTLIIIDCYFPDGTVVIEEVFKQCNSRIIHVHYTVNNFNATDVLPAQTPVSIYVNSAFLDYTETLEDIAIGESESNYITLTIPVGVPLDFDLTFVVDDTGDGTGTVIELIEDNNSNTLPTSLVLSPVLQEPADMTSCDIGFEAGNFDFSAYAETLKNYPNETVTFYGTQPNADQDIDRIYNTTQFVTRENPQRIYVRLDNGTCHTTSSFLLQTKKCAPTTFNYVTPNDDGYNDSFFVEGLRNIFLNFKMNIYNRWGNLVWTGNHSEADWNGIADVEKVGPEGTTVPTGTYYFVLELHDPAFPEPIVGWVYVTK